MRNIVFPVLLALIVLCSCKAVEAPAADVKSDVSVLEVGLPDSATLADAVTLSDAVTAD